jgi:hypothetical protein
MAEAIVTLALDREKRLAIARHNRRTLPDMIWERVLARTEAAYAEAGAAERENAA